MLHFAPPASGWHPSLPDFRDYSPDAAPASQLLMQLGPSGGKHADRPASVDLREYFVDVDDQGTLAASSAHACCALAEYFERRATGRLLRPSRLFVYQNALSLAGLVGNCPIDLRTTFKALVRCGAPPERLWPYEPARLATSPEGFLYCFDNPYRAITYLRLDGRRASPIATLDRVRAYLAAGFPAAFGLAVPDALAADGTIHYRPTFSSVIGGQALVAVGYDDRWLRGSRGALLVRSSWGPGWGEAGYGWLPYAFVEERLATEFWTLVHPEWIRSGEFDAPAL